MGWALVIALGLLLAGWGTAGQAQEATPPAARNAPELLSGILTVEPDRLISETTFGRETRARLEAEAASLLAENQKIDADLEAEERALTDRRALVTPDEFRPLAEAFDAKVEAIRARQEAKGRVLSQERDAARQTVLSAAVPVLAQLLSERGASAMLDKANVIISFDRNDVTDEAIRRLNAVLPPDVVPPAPQP